MTERARQWLPTQMTFFFVVFLGWKRLEGCLCDGIWPNSPNIESVWGGSGNFTDEPATANQHFWFKKATLELFLSVVLTSDSSAEFSS